MAAKAGPMVRAQLLLTPAQRKRLERLSRREGRSLSEVTRRALDAGLDVLEGDTEEAARRRLAELAALRRLNEEIRAEKGVYQGDLVAQTRKERERERERVWKGRPDAS